MAIDESRLQPLCACFGHPVGGNPTQFMMERAFAHHDLDWRYLTLDIVPDDLQAAMRGMRAMGFRGANITQPHKREVLNYLDQLSDDARLMGAVNCIRREASELIGENTDGQGFLQALREQDFDPAEKSVVILGAGGAARAIAVALAQAGCRQIEIVNRSRERGEELVRILNEHFRPNDPSGEVEESAAAEDAAKPAAGESSGSDAATAAKDASPSATQDAAATATPASAVTTADQTASEAGGAADADTDANAAAGDDNAAAPTGDGVSSPFATFFEWTDEYDIPVGTQLLINATSIGLFEPNTRVPVAADTLEGVTLAADVIFNPTETRFLAEAKSHGCQVLGGLGMLVHQGAIAFEIWTGQTPDLEVMQDALEEFFGV